MDGVLPFSPKTQCLACRTGTGSAHWELSASMTDNCLGGRTPLPAPPLVLSVRPPLLPRTLCLAAPAQPFLCRPTPQLLCLWEVTTGEEPQDPVCTGMSPLACRQPGLLCPRPCPPAPLAPASPAPGLTSTSAASTFGHCPLLLPQPCPSTWPLCPRDTGGFLALPAPLAW